MAGRVAGGDFLSDLRLWYARASAVPLRLLGGRLRLLCGGRFMLVKVMAMIVLATAVPVAQADQLTEIRHKGELVCGVLATDEPMSFVDPQTRTIVGYDVDLCRAVARKIGVRATAKQIAVGARIPELQQGHVDLL